MEWANKANGGAAEIHSSGTKINHTTARMGGKSSANNQLQGDYSDITCENWDN